MALESLDGPDERHGEHPDVGAEVDDLVSADRLVEPPGGVAGVSDDLEEELERIVAGPKFDDHTIAEDERARHAPASAVLAPDVGPVREVTGERTEPCRRADLPHQLRRHSAH